MTVARYEPWNLHKQLQSEINKILESSLYGAGEGDNSSVVTSHWTPAVDIKEEKDRFVLFADIPGVDPKDIEVTMDKGVLTIRGERPSEGDEERAAFKRMERARGTFYRRFSLPDSADAERVTARGVNGVLEIAIPKQEKLQPRKIAVQD
jgi:HSP20 family protein